MHLDSWFWLEDVMQDNAQLVKLQHNSITTNTQTWVQGDCGQIDSDPFKGWNSKAHRECPRNYESTILSRDITIIISSSSSIIIIMISSSSSSSSSSITSITYIITTYYLYYHCYYWHYSSLVASRSGGVAGGRVAHEHRRHLLGHALRDVVDVGLHLIRYHHYAHYYYHCCC